MHSRRWKTGVSSMISLLFLSWMPVSCAVGASAPRPFSSTPRAEPPPAPAVPSELPEDPFQRAIALYQQGKVGEALEAFQSLENASGRADVQAYIAFCYGHQGRWDEALQAADHALHLDEDLILAYAAKAYALAGKGSFEDALKVLQAAREKAPDHVEVAYATGLVRYLQKAYKGAAPALQEAVDKDPQRPYAHYYLGMTYYNLNQKATAIQYLENFLRLAPEAPEASQVRDLLQRLKRR
ncbi:MAG: tetratricopeptide repeat protein [Acidobacteria bacterium]|nr:tetratricopeptide repeat protein [Acidobacteriota bacterium]MDW7983759.1 tetratricopeptide repeat protein [Acidobacteriota bacterium]